jgi:thiamine biosynthesis lipoprotein
MAVLNRKFQVMGCPCEIILEAEQDKLSSVADLAIVEAKRFEKKYSRYREDSVVSAINRAAGVERVNIDEETHLLLSYAETCFLESNGLFDITSGVLRKVWHKEMVSMPDTETLQHILQTVGWEHVDRTSSTIFLTKPEMEIDFGGFGKEYAADAMASLIRQHGVAHGIVNLGGDIVVLGPHLSGAAWQIGITHPTVAGDAIATIAIESGAITTSGGYERYFEVSGKRYSHLLNPKTGRPVDGLLSVSVTAKHCLVAGSLATIAMLNDSKNGLAWLEDAGQPFLAFDKHLAPFGSLRDL